MELRSLFHLNHSVGTPIQFSKQNRCSKMIIHTRRKNASVIFTISVKVVLLSITLPLRKIALKTGKEGGIIKKKFCLGERGK
jgi:hypothetical protein